MNSRSRKHPSIANSNNFVSLSPLLTPLIRSAVVHDRAGADLHAMIPSVRTVLTLLSSILVASVRPEPVGPRAVAAATVIRIESIGYLPNAPKTAIACASSPTCKPARGPHPERSHSQSRTRQVEWYRQGATHRPGGIRAVRRHVPARLRGSARPGGIASCPVTCGRPWCASTRARTPARRHAPVLHAPAALRLQPDPARLGPQARRHHRRSPTRTGEFINVSGGWADAADYLQYVTTSATATYVMLSRVSRHPARVRRQVRRATGCPAPTASPTCSTRRGTASSGCSRMFPDDATMFNQLADDRDHTYLRPAHDRLRGLRLGQGEGAAGLSVYGQAAGSVQREESRDWLRVHRRQVRGDVRARRARLFATSDPAFARQLRDRALAAYAFGVKYPGQLPDRARPLALLLRRRELGGRHGARRRRAVCAHARAAVPARRARLRARGAGDAMDGRRHGASLRVVSRGSTTATTRSGAAATRGERAQMARYYAKGSSASSRARRRTAFASASRSSGARTTSCRRSRRRRSSIAA